MTLNWNHLAPVERAEKLSGAWDGTWFTEDYCEGPGQALIVNPRGEVKPCCGSPPTWTSSPSATSTRTTVGRIVRRARRHPVVGKIFREGLSSLRDEILARDPDALPGPPRPLLFLLVRPDPRPGERCPRRRRPDRAPGPAPAPTSPAT